ncbi:acetate/propionate family kinase [Rhizobium sp. P40RR-XXII]|uniref:acetate/propionate family kinase n=1 Tax=Rhizobium sp. P40RR-XXII TaxID=2726739 RepID=UPI0014566A30|nr:acetate/propionate family kinase [Rhizobium sp. P40RR-XXII]NLS18699.1 acetate/propionate family kinase [Rhizobium sp. P40RR-XXII]
MTKALITLNAGSSSLKFAVFSHDGIALDQKVHGKIEGIGTAPHLIAKDMSGRVLTEHRWENGSGLGHEDFFRQLLDWIDEHLGDAELIGAGHRVVHGGAQFYRPVRVTPSLLGALKALIPLAPLHQPHNLAAIEAVAAVRPQLAQVACFDTAFHHDQPPVASRLAIPRALSAEGVKRYGFHGISYEFIARRLAEIDPALAAGKIIVAHLGNGASLCAIKGGRSIDTTMGFTALDGLVMGTRCGSIDPGVLLYLLQHHGMTPAALSHLLYDQSGLLGVSGISSDMRELLGSDNPHAIEAVELFCYHIAREAGALVSSMGGLDGFIFTAGIGENAVEIRRLVCERLAWLDVAVDQDANARHDAIISTAESRVIIRVLPTDEERMIALHTTEALDRSARAPAAAFLPGLDRSRPTNG